MNALLFAPALALLMLQACRTGTIFAGAALAIAMQVRQCGWQGRADVLIHPPMWPPRPQVVLGAPFLAAHPAQYLGRAFEFGRQFQQQWSVNLQFLPPAVFTSRHTALLLLGLHLALLAGVQRWMGGGHNVHATVAVSHSRTQGLRTRGGCAATAACCRCSGAA